MYYIGFLLLPIHLNILIYFSYKLKLQESNTIAVRRFLVYLFLGILIVRDTHSKFYSLLFYDTLPEFDLYSLYVYMIGAVFIAIERILRVIINDYKNFTSKQSYSFSYHVEVNPLDDTTINNNPTCIK